MRTVVGKLVMFPIAPDVLHWIEFRRIGGQVVELDPALLAGDKLPDQPSAMGVRAIPDHQELAGGAADDPRSSARFFGKAGNKSSTK